MGLKAWTKRMNPFGLALVMVSATTQIRYCYERAGSPRFRIRNKARFVLRIRHESVARHKARFV